MPYISQEDTTKRTVTGEPSWVSWLRVSGPRVRERVSSCSTWMDDDEVVRRSTGSRRHGALNCCKPRPSVASPGRPPPDQRSLPVTDVWHDNSVIFRTSPYGPLSELSQPTNVAFEVDEIDQQHHQGWSVVVHGRAQGVVRSDEVVRLWPWAVSPGRRDAQPPHPDHAHDAERPGGGSQARSNTDQPDRTKLHRELRRATPVDGVVTTIDRPFSLAAMGPT